ncbi:LOW QUALITY PROTEIN: hypothetical protein PHMEG_00026395 [Phytophthora megakarya]|uniref:Uncharacterized protein n=1 Tax=Phytophthora megakarya TaxID=4795 RepID=A0A225V9P3_9STRA|nr:LOW QUALITY PROTEIN: hypothetical protein PHMEG_00026395 [Phytophthora megakarya]
MAPNSSKATPASLGKAPATPVSTPAHISGNTPGGGGTEHGDGRASIPQPSSRRPSSSEESEEPAPGDIYKEKSLDDKSSGDESGVEDDAPKKVPSATKPTVVERSSSKRASRTLKMSEIECMSDNLENDRATKKKLTAPATMTLPPSSAATLAFETTGEARFVGIPATREHLRGLEPLIQMESLGLRELAFLADYVDEGEEIYDYILTPRETPLLNGEQDEVVKSRVFGTVSVLQKVTAERIMLSRQLAVPNQTTQDVAKGLVEIERLNKELAIVRAGYEQRIQKIDEDHEFHAGKHRADLQKYMAEDRANLHGLQAQVRSLQAQLRAVLARDDAPQHPRMDIDNIMNFLDANSQLSLQWPRLRALLEHCLDDIPVSTSWKTTRSWQAMTLPYPLRHTSRYLVQIEMVTRSKRGVTILRIILGDHFLDLTRDSESDSSKSGGKRKRSSKSPRKPNKPSQSDVPMEIQEYPSEWAVNLIRLAVPMEIYYYEMLRQRMLKPFPVIWKQLRLDVRALILYGINYEGALEWLEEDRPVHGCIHQCSLWVMLLRKMFWNELDVTPWTKYVPRRYYVAARAKLDSLLEIDDQPDLWDPLIPVLEDTVDPTDLVPEQDDPTDQNWTNDGEEDDNDDEDDDLLDGSPSESTRAKTKRRRIAPVEMKNPVKRQHQQKTCTMLALKEYLTADEMMIIEIPRNDKVRSWVHFGVRIKWCDKSLNSPFGQTPGFPSYTLNRHDLEFCKGDSRTTSTNIERFFAKRRGKICGGILLYFHKRSAMTPTAQGALDTWVEYMCESMRHQWEMLHWVIFLLELLPDSAVLAESRRGKRHESLVKKGKSLKRRCIQKGFPATVFEWERLGHSPPRLSLDYHGQESNLSCHPKSISLREQLQRLNKAEPARLQWTNCGSVAEQIAHLPEGEWESISEDI